jgi:hypothetical protein
MVVLGSDPEMRTLMIVVILSSGIVQMSLPKPYVDTTTTFRSASNKTQLTMPAAYFETLDLQSQGNMPVRFSSRPRARDKKHISEVAYKCQNNGEVGPAEEVVTVGAVIKPHDNRHNGKTPRYGGDHRGHDGEIPNWLATEGFCCIQSRCEGQP